MGWMSYDGKIDGREIAIDVAVTAIGVAVIVLIATIIKG